MFKTRTLSGFLVVMTFVSWSCSSATAELIRHNYFGNEFTTHDGLFPPDDKFTGFIDIETDQLGGSDANKIITEGPAIPFFSITDGDRNFNQSNVGGGNFLGFATDGSGNIVDWFFHLGESVFLFTSKSNSTQHFFDIGFCCSTDFIPFGDRNSNNLGPISASNTNPGIWVKEVVQSIPEPNSLFPLLIAFLWLGLFVLCRERQVL